MKDILAKISDYNLFNYFFPGVLFAIIVSKTTQYNLIQENLVFAPFVYYFLGLVISRFGSVIIEEFLEKLSFVHFAPYPKFVEAEKKDAENVKKIPLLLEVNNTYRTLLSMFVLLLLVKAYSFITIRLEFPPQAYSTYFVIVLLALLFALSFRKQSKYIKERVEAINSSTEIPVVAQGAVVQEHIT